MKTSPDVQVVTITLNPAIDRTITIPNFSVGKVNRVTSEHSQPGGKGVNVAMALAEAGNSVAVSGFLGAENASSFETLFKARGIVDNFIRIPGQTRTGIKISDPAQQQTTDINFPGLIPSTQDLHRLREEISRLSSSSAKIFVIAGSLPPGVSPTIYREMVTLLKECGKKVVLDTSGEPFVHAMQAVPNIIKPNIHELEAFLGVSLNSDSAVVKAAHQVLSRGLELVVISMGEKGALFVDHSDAFLAVPPSIEIKSTVGAGDSMVAGVVSGKLLGMSLRTMAAHATASSLKWLTNDTRHDAIEHWTTQVDIKSLAGRAT